MSTHVILDVEIEACTSCGGILLDKGETEDIERLGVAAIVEGTAPVAEDSTAPRDQTAHCYTCNTDMIALTGAGDVEYDWCAGCERLFFDRGELSILDAFMDL